MTNIMGNTPAEESSGSFDEAAFKKIVQDVFTTTSHSESYPNNLSGSIHPIFSRGQWHIHPAILQHDSDGEEFLRLIDPVLHLTSNLLQSPNSRLFLAYIFYAGREYLVDVSNRLGRVMRQFNKIEGLDFSEALVRTTALLDRLAGQIDFRWFDPANPANDDERRFGHSLGFCKRREASACISDSGEATGYMSCISLNLDMFVKLRDLHRSLQDGSLAKVEGISSQILRLQFVMAISTCHEIVHAFNIAINCVHGFMEPFFEDERLAELGHSWEGFVIGGLISVHSNAAESTAAEGIAANALLLCKWPGFYRGTKTTMERSLPFPFRNQFFIPMDWITQIQQEKEWQSTNPDDITALLAIPRTLGFTESYDDDDYDPDWKSKWVNELEYIFPQGSNLEPKNPSSAS